jgi:hypothetical protein
LTVIEGDTPKAEGTTPEPTPAVPEEPKPNSERTFTQEQLNRINKDSNAKAAAAAKQQALQEIADTLGMSLEDAKTVLQERQAEEDAKKSELDRIREELESTKTTSGTTITELQQTNHKLNVKLQLSQAGLNLPEDKKEAAEALERVVGLVTAPVGAAADDIAENIGALRQQFPALFSDGTLKPTPNPPSNPSGAPRQLSLGANASDIGAELAAQANAKRGVKPTA